MIAGFLAFAGRQRRAILAVGVVLSASYLLVHAWAPSLGRRAFPALAAICLSLLALGLAATIRRRPAAFVIQPGLPAFSASPQPASLIMALALLTLGTAMTGIAIRYGEPNAFLDQLLAWSLAAATLLHVVLVWRDQGVQLRPDGLWQHGFTGWLVIPWDASPTVPTLPPSPGAISVRLRFGRPDLVRRHGLPVYRRSLRTQDVDPGFITAAIRYYVAHPEHRPAIGTRAEYERLMPQLTSAEDGCGLPTASRCGTVER
ncbi:hypothetical protein [Phytohabitans aurantiacus]|uniref:Uncharacterized protein n=1 Tax=Phytohabitans aurantiacus TaxID=3016789 RepID=A0ABQ5RAI9_9ACTN|nr:hypothetical protein [Phytohabitans aurantiacus]GLI03767.1 hypothetical protein Pa4123_90470 [Phytohabitans aurantiacus]